MISYPESAVERAMKVQGVMLQATAKKITWWQASEILGISDRHLRRWRERYAEFGFRGLFDRRRGRPSPKRVPVAVVERVLGLYRERYFDLNLRHFHEKLAEHQIRLSYSWVKGILQGAGLVAQGRQRGTHRKRRPRRPLPGMLLHIDGSRHHWFQDERWYDLLVVLDDASSEIYYAQLVEEESTRTVLAAFNQRFRVPAPQPGSAFLPCRRGDLDFVFSLHRGWRQHGERSESVAADRTHQLARQFGRCRVTVHEHLDGTRTIRYGPHVVGRYNAQGWPLLEETTRRRKAVEKPLRGKPKTGFPLRLEIPQPRRDSHFPTASAATEPHSHG